MQKLPVVTRAGVDYPVPWFVAQDERGEYDFRTYGSLKYTQAVKNLLCWVCGEKLGIHMAFVIGPMCMVNRTTAEPPCHRECAVYSATHCPFLANPDQKRNVRKIHGPHENPGGEMLLRNPGVAVVWITRGYQIFLDNFNKPLLKIQPAEEVLFFREGRAATRAEVVDSIETGFPSLYDMAVEEGHFAVEELFKAKDFAYKLLPA